MIIPCKFRIIIENLFKQALNNLCKLSSIFFLILIFIFFTMCDSTVKRMWMCGVLCTCVYLCVGKKKNQRTQEGVFLKFSQQFQIYEIKQWESSMLGLFSLPDNFWFTIYCSYFHIITNEVSQKNFRLYLFFESI